MSAQSGSTLQTVLIIVKLKKRIIMMNTKKNSKVWRWKVVTFLPLFALMLMAFGKPSGSRINKEIQNETVNILQPVLNEEKQTIDPEVVTVHFESNLFLNDHKKQKTAISEELAKQVPQKIIKGKVIDEYGNALKGVSVVGSSRMKTTTDANGNFEITMIEDLPLWFSHAGLTTTARTPPEFEESTIVKMAPDVYSLGVTVVGYSTVKSSDVSQRNIDSNSNEPNNDKNNKIFSIAEQMPEFPGGIAALRKFIAKQIKYPEIAQQDKANGEVHVNFVINREGRVWYAKVVKPVHPALDQEAIRVIYSMPQWKPGVNHGEKVNVGYTIPIKFSYNVTRK